MSGLWNVIGPLKGMAVVDEPQNVKSVDDAAELYLRIGGKYAIEEIECSHRSDGCCCVLESDSQVFHTTYNSKVSWLAKHYRMTFHPHPFPETVRQEPDDLFENCGIPRLLRRPTFQEFVKAFRIRCFEGGSCGKVSVRDATRAAI